MQALRIFIRVSIGMLLLPATAAAVTLQVGPGKSFAKPCAAILAAAPGDTIEIDTNGNYDGDVCAWSANNLTIRGVGPGRARIDAAGNNAQGKGIWVIQGSATTVENIEFLGATVPDNNGAGIRQEGPNLTVRNCYFHDNEEGILAGDNPNSTILIEFSEFGFNGFGDGFTHNIYVTHISKFIFRYNYSHHSKIGHLVKSRAAENHILYNRLSDEGTGTGSYEIDLPNGGKSFLIGNLIEQGPQTSNSTILSYLEEGTDIRNPSHELFVVNNTFVNDFPSGTFVFMGGGSAPATIRNNIIVGAGTLTNQVNAVLSSNFQGDPLFVDPLNYDYHLRPGSPAIDAGTDPGSGGGLSLTPVFQYVHPSCAEGRTTVRVIDIGAYEAGGGSGVPPSSAPSRCAVGSSAPVVTLTPTQLAFSNQLLNVASTPLDVTLTNSGNAGLNISSISASGDFLETNTCGSGVPAGNNCRISVTFKPSASGLRNGLLTVVDDAAGSPHTLALSGTGQAFSLSASPLSATVNAGESASFMLTVTAADGFHQTVSLTCNGAPRGVSCTTNPSSVTLTGSMGATAAVQVATTARGLGSPRRKVVPVSHQPGISKLWIFVTVLLILVLVIVRRQMKPVCALSTLIVLFPGCTGTNSKTMPPGGTPAGTYTLTVEGTSGSATSSTNFTLTVR